MTTFQAYPTGICDWIAVIHLTEKKKNVEKGNDFKN